MDAVREQFEEIESRVMQLADDIRGAVFDDLDQLAEALRCGGSSAPVMTVARC